MLIKVHMIVLWDREDYMKESEKQLHDKEVYRKISHNDAPLLKTINAV